MYQQPSYLIKKGSVFYFPRRVPFDLQSQFMLERYVVKSRHHIVVGDHEDIKQDLKFH
jgi:hypothetical protein